MAPESTCVDLKHYLKLYETWYSRDQYEPPREVGGSSEDGDDTEDDKWSETTDSDLESKTSTTFVNQRSLSDEVSDEETTGSMVLSPDSDSFNGSPEDYDDDVSEDTDTDTSPKLPDSIPTSHPYDSDFYVNTDEYDPSTNGSELTDDDENYDDSTYGVNLQTFEALELKKSENFVALSKGVTESVQKVLERINPNHYQADEGRKNTITDNTGYLPLVTGVLLGSALACLPALSKTLV